MTVRRARGSVDRTVNFSDCEEQIQKKNRGEQESIQQTGVYIVAEMGGKENVEAIQVLVAKSRNVFVEEVYDNFGIKLPQRNALLQRFAVYFTAYMVVPPVQGFLPMAR